VRGRASLKVLVVICLVALVTVSYVIWQSTQPVSTDQSFTLTDTNGERFSLADFKGKVVVLDLFATTCMPCVYEVPQLAEICRKYGSDVEVISIGSPSDTVDGLRQFKSEYQMTWRVARDTDGVFEKYGVEYIPTLVIIDRNGTMRHRYVGLTEASTLSSRIDPLLSE
jgi:peroxiredoxin